MQIKPEKVDHAIAFLIGEVHGLSMVCQMMTKVHPDHEMLLKEIADIKQRGIASRHPGGAVSRSGEQLRPYFFCCSSIVRDITAWIPVSRFAVSIMFM